MATPRPAGRTFRPSHAYAFAAVVAVALAVATLGLALRDIALTSSPALLGWQTILVPLAAWMLALAFRRRVELGPSGIRIVHLFSEESMAWPDVRELWAGAEHRLRDRWHLRLVGADRAVLIEPMDWREGIELGQAIERVLGNPRRAEDAPSGVPPWQTAST